MREAMLLHRFNHDRILKLEALTKDPSTGDVFMVLPFVVRSGHRHQEEIKGGER
jgi:hypothetical protein